MLLPLLLNNLLAPRPTPPTPIEEDEISSSSGSASMASRYADGLNERLYRDDEDILAILKTFLHAFN